MEEAWHALLDGTPPHRHTQLPEWAIAAWRSDHHRTARWVLAEDGHGPVALLHCLLLLRRVAGVRFRVLANGPADGLLAPRADPAALRPALLAALHKNGVPVDILSLNRLHESSPFAALARASGRPLRNEPRHGGRSLIDTTVPASTWFEQASKNLRKTLRKHHNRAAREGALQTTVATSPDDVARGFEEYLALEAAGWKGHAGALVNRPEERTLLEEALRAAAPRGHAQVRSLHLDGRPAATQLIFQAGTTCALVKITYNEDLAHLSPGNLLRADLVRACCDTPGTDRIDLITNQPWHRQWRQELQPTFAAHDYNLSRPPGLAAGTVTSLAGLARRARRRSPEDQSAATAAQNRSSSASSL